MLVVESGKTCHAPGVHHECVNEALSHMLWRAPLTLLELILRICEMSNNSVRQYIESVCQPFPPFLGPCTNSCPLSPSPSSFPSFSSLSPEHQSKSRRRKFTHVYLPGWANKNIVPWLVWLSLLERRPVNQNVTGVTPGQGTCSVPSQGDTGVCMEGNRSIFLSHQCYSLSPFEGRKEGR